MAVNLAVMDVVGRQEAPVFTWNPVEQMWVQERGGAAKPPPAPHDVHAIQTWFLDSDENEWIQTVLGPMGRQLAAQWRGAHRVPDGAIARPAKATKKGSPLPILLGGLVTVALIGGVALAAPGLMIPSETPAPSLRSRPARSRRGSDPRATRPHRTPPAEAQPNTSPVATTCRHGASRTAGPSYTLKNGTVVTYTGRHSIAERDPSRIVRRVSRERSGSERCVRRLLE